MDFPLASALLHGALLTLIFLPHAVLSTPLKLTVPSNIVSCTTTTISWQGGSAPYTLTFEENGVTLETAVVINDTTFDWDVDIAPGIPIVLILRDSNNDQTTSSQFTTRSGTASCNEIQAPDSLLPMSTDVQTISASGFLTFITATRPLTTGSITSTPTQQTQPTISHSSSSTTAPNALSEGSSSKPSASTIGFIVLAIVLVISFGVIAALFWIRRRKKRHVRMSVDLLAEGKMRSAESFEIVLPFNASTPLSHGGTFEQQMNRRDDGDVVMSFSDVRSPPRDHSDGVDSLPRSKSDHEYPSSTNRSDESSFTPIPTHPVSHDRLYSNSSDPSIYSAEAETSTIFKNASTVSLLGIRHPAARREADGGVRLAGGPVRESWFVNGGTLPPAYGEFR